MGRGGGQGVSVLVFFSGDLRSNPTEWLQFFLDKLCLKRVKINKKRSGLAHLKSHFFECKFSKMIFCGHNQALPTINRFILIAIILNNKFSLRSSKIKKNIAKFERFAVSFFSA